MYGCTLNARPAIVSTASRLVDRQRLLRTIEKSEQCSSHVELALDDDDDAPTLHACVLDFTRSFRSSRIDHVCFRVRSHTLM